MTTYATDAQVSEWDAAASQFVPTSDEVGGVPSFARLRQRAYEEIGRRLLRREPQVRQADLGRVAELTHAEVLFTLHRLYAEAAAKVGDDGTLKWRSEEAFKKFVDEMENVRIPSGDDETGTQMLQSVVTVPIWRR
jgi:hypothetical protein